jgi:ubiquinone biosynthesis protein COQ9
LPPEDDSLNAIRRRVLGHALEAAAFDGFTGLSLRRAVREAGLADSDMAAAFPSGPADLVAFWSREADEAAAAGAGEGGIRQRVTNAILARLDYLRPHREAARRAAAFLALPHHAATGAQLLWATSDAIWRALGDTSTDSNYYTKRASLSAVLASTTARWLADDSDGDAATRDFLAARIENIMQFERAKKKMREMGVDPEGMFGWLGRLRYPR